MGQQLARLRLRLGWRSPPTTTFHWIYISGEEEAGGDKPEQEELWGRVEERWLGQDFLGAFKLFFSKLSLVSRGVAGLP